MVAPPVHELTLSMDASVADLLRCPTCVGPLTFVASTPGNDANDGAFTCRQCRATYPVTRGVPNFLPPEPVESLTQSESSFSAKWNRVADMYDEDTFNARFQREWYLNRYKWGNEERLRSFLADKRLVLDAGCGLGRDVRWYASLNPNCRVLGVDLSEAIFHGAAKASGLSNVAMIRGDLYNLPFAPGGFDFVASDQVLSNVSDPRAAVSSLWRHVRPGGHMAFYLYKRKAAIREFTDDHIRQTVTRLSTQAGWEACRPITELGKALSDLKVTVTIPSDVPLLDLKAGTYDLQRFIYYNVLKCFWNDRMSFDENNAVNFDWFHPQYTFRYSPDEVRQWAADLKMNVLVLDEDDASGISVLAGKDAL
jgi:SAM-dependent methyltransferase/uncharacterized protein YbaR (Trm112 family)